MEHSHSQPTAPLARFSWSKKETILFAVFILIGVVSFIIGLITDPQRAWANYLTDYFYWLCISLAGVFFTALQHITGSSWSATVRRVAETFIGFLPVAVVLFVGLLFGLHYLFEWTHTDNPAVQHLLHLKGAYLNTPFFVIRSLILFALCFFIGGWMIKNSLKQDVTRDPKLTFLNRTLAAIFLLIFAWAFSFVAFDLMMSLWPHWFSTIFGVYCWSGLFYSGLAMITLWTIMLKKRGLVTGYVTVDHIHDLGKLMFGFLVFWAYIGFSQFMLIWYANLPEETPYMIARAVGGWNCISIALMVGKFALPFFLIISRAAKRCENWMVFMCFWYLAAQWLDVYWMVYPTFYPEAPVFGFLEIGMFLGFVGLFALSVGRALSRVNPVAIGDPFMNEALHHHQ